jgi:hypothetical protein
MTHRLCDRCSRRRPWWQITVLGTAGIGGLNAVTAWLNRCNPGAVTVLGVLAAIWALAYATSERHNRELSTKLLAAEILAGSDQQTPQEGRPTP